MGNRRLKSIHDRGYQLIVAHLREAREKSKITQAELAERLGTDQSYVSKYERTERRLDLLEVRAICICLEVDFVRFVGRLESELQRRGNP